MNYEKLDEKFDEKKHESDVDDDGYLIKDEATRDLIWTRCSWGLGLIICILVICFVWKFFTLIDNM